MATASFRWLQGPSVIVDGIRRLAKRILDRAYRLAVEFAKRIEAWARAHAVWTDRTGEARRRLAASVIKTATVYSIVLAHGVFYGIFLELANQGRFAIINRAMEAHYGAYMAELQRLVR